MVHLSTLNAGQLLLDNRTANGQGFCLQTTARGTIELALNDGRTENRWDCDPGMLQVDKAHHLVAIVDGGPKIISFVVDGVFNDGGEFRQFGWGRYSPNLRGISGSPVGAILEAAEQGQRKMLRIGPNIEGKVLSVRIYDRYLLTSEAIGNYQAGTFS